MGCNEMMYCENGNTRHTCVLDLTWVLQARRSPSRFKICCYSLNMLPFGLPACTHNNLHSDSHNCLIKNGWLGAACGCSQLHARLAGLSSSHSSFELHQKFSRIAMLFKDISIICCHINDRDHTDEEHKAHRQSRSLIHKVFVHMRPISDAWNNILNFRPSLAWTKLLFMSWASCPFMKTLW